MKNFETLQELAALVGQAVSTSDWVLVTQEHINQFAQATGDHQWIHVDVERAKAGPFGAPIAHGFLTLSLIPTFFASAVHIAQVRMGVNYGLVFLGWGLAFFVPQIAGYVKDITHSMDPAFYLSAVLLFAAVVVSQTLKRPVLKS